MWHHITFDRIVIFVTLLISIFGAYPALMELFDRRVDLRVTNWSQSETSLTQTTFDFRASVDIVNVAPTPVAVLGIEAVAIEAPAKSGLRILDIELVQGPRSGEMRFPVTLDDGERITISFVVPMIVQDDDRAEFHDALEHFGYSEDDLMGGLSNFELTGREALEMFRVTYFPQLARYSLTSGRPCDLDDLFGSQLMQRISRCVVLFASIRGDREIELARGTIGVLPAP